MMGTGVSMCACGRGGAGEGRKPLTLAKQRTQ